MIPPKKPLNWPKFAIAVIVTHFLFQISALAGTDDQQIYRQRAMDAYAQTKAQFTTATNLSPAAWVFARACYDLADFATNDDTRAALAHEGMDACNKLIAAEPKSGAGHYYLGMNEGQLARTELVGALFLVKDMEPEFKLAWTLDPTVDHGGPARSLGLLYREAPGWPTSIGSRRKAWEWLEKADHFDPSFPENPMVLCETGLKWGNYKDADKYLQDLKKIWATAKTNLTGATWEHDWADWADRRKQAQSKINAHQSSSSSLRQKSAARVLRSPDMEGLSRL